MMDTHVHLLFRLPDQNENFFTAYLLELMGQKCPTDILVEPIKNYSQYLNVYKYIYRNPVEAGLSLMCESYPYSTLNSILGQSTQHLKVIDSMSVIQNPRKILTWLNSETHYKDSKLKDVRQDNSFLM
jgi:putative transposase